MIPNTCGFRSIAPHPHHGLFAHIFTSAWLTIASRKEIEDTFKFARHSMTATQHSLTERYGRPVACASKLKGDHSASYDGHSDKIVSTAKPSDDRSPKKVCSFNKGHMY